MIERLLPNRLTNSGEVKLVRIEKNSFGGTSITGPNSTVQLETTLSGTSFACDLLSTALDLSSRGVDHPLFFYYDNDRVIDDPHESYSFFVGDGAGTIVSERITLFRSSSNGFVPRALKEMDSDAPPIWGAEDSIRQARIRWWYRKFYEETEAGRLTTLRDDVDLYHFVPEWKLRAQQAEVASLVLLELKRVRWLVILCFLALIISLFHLI